LAALSATEAAAEMALGTISAEDYTRACLERGGDASSKQLRDLVAEGSRNSALRYLAARDGVLRYRAGLADILKDYDASLTPPAIRLSMRFGL
jgi:hypothetical protein